MIRIALALASAAVMAGVTAVAAQTDVAAARNQFMKQMGEQGYATLNRMVRGQVPYDQAKVEAAFAHFVENAPKIPALFPPGGYRGPVANTDYYASQKAFDSQADITARAAKFAKDAAEAKPKVKDLDSLKAVWPAVLKDNCDSCHEPYRVKKT